MVKYLPYFTEQGGIGGFEGGILQMLFLLSANSATGIRFLLSTFLIIFPFERKKILELKRTGKILYRIGIDEKEPGQYSSGMGKCNMVKEVKKLVDRISLKIIIH